MIINLHRSAIIKQENKPIFVIFLFNQNSWNTTKRNQKEIKPKYLQRSNLKGKRKSDRQGSLQTPSATSRNAPLTNILPDIGVKMVTGQHLLAVLE